MVGNLRVPLMKPVCSFAECNLGNVMADSYVHHYATAVPSSVATWTPASIALIAVGGLRTTLSKGRTFAAPTSFMQFSNHEFRTFAALIYSDLITAIPFENTVDTLDLRGKVLKDVLEYSVSASWDADKFNGKYMCHVSGKYGQQLHFYSKLIEFSMRL